MRPGKAPARLAAFDMRLTRFSKRKHKELNTVVQPDPCVIFDPAYLHQRGCIGMTDLVVEILSPGNSKTKMKDKFDLYRKDGVRKYWIVFPGERSVQIFKLNESGQFIRLQPCVDGATS